MKTLKQIYIDATVKRIVKEGILNEILAKKLAKENWKTLNPLIKEWLQQNLDEMPKGEFGEKTMLLVLLEELEQK